MNLLIGPIQKIIYLLGISALLHISACFGPVEFPEVIYPDPHVEEPPAGGGPFFMGALYPYDHTGYKTQEFFFAGEAHSYVNTEPLGQEGMWSVAHENSTHYRSRMIVYRPTNPENFNGTVLVEWLNVSGGIEAPADWIMMHAEIVRRGYAWVGVSAQYVGVETGVDAALPTVGTIALKAIAPDRYYTLRHPGDSFSYDIFSQAARALRHPVGLSPLGEDLDVQHLIAVGESQSASRLVSFINAFGTAAEHIDGYFIHSRLGQIPGIAEFQQGSAPLSQAPQVDIVAPQVVKIRADLRKPVMNLQTETDLFVLGAFDSRQEDTDTYRLWEVAGAAHADYNTSAIGRRSVSFAEIATVYSTTPFFSCPDMINSAPQHHFVTKAALYALRNWIVNGITPPVATRLVTNATENGFQYDAVGNVLGGVRSPYVDVPIARFSGVNSSAISSDDICFLFGETEMLDVATLRSLYQNHDDYVDQTKSSVEKAVAAGFLLPEDAPLIIDAARANKIF